MVNMLSVVLATYNEEKNIAKCLTAIKDLADEIIVVDGSSTDQTKQIAENLGAKVFQTTNKKNFHINKQMAMDKATCDLILQLDADELVDNELKTFIKKLLHSLEKKEKLSAAAWWIKRKNFFCNRWLSKGGQYPDPVIRLYLKNKAHLPAKDVHEQMQVDGLIADAEGHILHYSNPTFQDYWRKFQTYTSFKAQQLAATKLVINPFSFFNYLLIKPVVTFFSIYFRHLGLVDGWQGFVFAFFSGLHHPVAYLKFLRDQDAN